MDDRFEIVVFDDGAANVALAASGVAGKEAAAVVHRSDAAAKRTDRKRLDLVHHLHQKEKLPVAATWHGVHFVYFAPVVGQIHPKARIDHFVAVFDVALLTRPGFAVGRIGEHEVEVLAPELVGREGRAVADIFGVVAFDEHVRFADGVGFVVDLFAVEVDVACSADGAVGVFDEFLRLGKHPAATAGGVVDLHHRRQPIFDRLEDDVGHELDHLTGREVLSGLFVVLFVETADQLLEDIAHPQIGECGQQIAVGVGRLFGTEVDPGGGKLLQNIEEDVLLCHMGDLGTELELLDDLLHIGAEAAEIFVEIALEQLDGVGRGRIESFERPGAGVVKEIATRRPEPCRIELCNPHILPLEAHLFHHRFLGLFQQRIETAQHHHRQDHIAVFPPHIDIAQTIVSDAPDEIDQFVVGGGIQFKTFLGNHIMTYSPLIYQIFLSFYIFFFINLQVFYHSEL